MIYLGKQAMQLFNYLNTLAFQVLLFVDYFVSLNFEVHLKRIQWFEENGHVKIVYCIWLR